MHPISISLATATIRKFLVVAAVLSALQPLAAPINVDAAEPAAKPVAKVSPGVTQTSPTVVPSPPLVPSNSSAAQPVPVPQPGTASNTPTLPKGQLTPTPLRPEDKEILEGKPSNELDTEFADEDLEELDELVDDEGLAGE